VEDTGDRSRSLTDLRKHTELYDKRGEPHEGRPNRGNCMVIWFSLGVPTFVSFEIALLRKRVNMRQREFIPEGSCNCAHGLHIQFVVVSIGGLCFQHCWPADHASIQTTERGVQKLKNKRATDSRSLETALNRQPPQADR
jgi:hypothetical protein